MWTCYTGRFIIFSVITKIYNKKTKGPTLMELFTATGKLIFFWTIRDVRCPHVDACVARTWMSYRCAPCHPWCTHRTSLVVNKKKNQFSWGCEQFHCGRSIGFLIINVCNHGDALWNALYYVWDDKYLVFEFIAYELWTIIIIIININVVIIIIIIIGDAVVDSDCEVICICRSVCSLA